MARASPDRSFGVVKSSKVQYCWSAQAAVLTGNVGVAILIPRFCFGVLSRGRIVDVIIGVSLGAIIR